MQKEGVLNEHAFFYLLFARSAIRRARST